MYKILEALAQDTLQTNRIPTQNPDDLQTLEQFSAAEKVLLEKLGENGMPLLDQYNQAKSLYEDSVSTDRFICGFRLGALMMIDVFRGQDGLPGETTN